MDHQEIRAVYSILHLLYHRNKNQHQRAKWWKWLSMLKRTASELAFPESKVFAASSCPQYLSLRLIPRCYHAFSTVVADNQFATLGVVLLAALARLAKATGIKYERPARTELKAPKAPRMKPTEDRGERICRDDADADAVANALPGTGRRHQPQSAKVGKPLKEKTKRVKAAKSSAKKKKNAIDDLFSGLL
ncbi:hypothetical protein N7532_006137 [Penicillium argentinense]|uniref:RNase MRP protein 1 RNA binding domain-containing protein n=1 Tax=Penicillium argentinense TaxID=1131581 RepID=A0A9W9KB26_9EURO|nr:uncharacterized protein N7532_006137 [Penicillium argentinense]KAJ5099136.1 hypothetical protein N7532_006137 [Penicillium argentinense]